MDEKIFSQFKTVPLRQPIAVKGLHTWPNLYKYILEELERCAKHPSYLSMFKESPTDTNPFNTSTFDIIRDRLKGTDTHLDIVSGELVLNTNKFHYKEDSLNKNTLYKLQWDFKSYNTLKDIKIPEFFELMESNKNKYISFKEQFGNFNLVPVGLNPSLYDLRIAKANKKRINGLCNILEKIENLYKTTYVDFTNSISEQLLQNFCSDTVIAEESLYLRNLSLEQELDITDIAIESIISNIKDFFVNIGKKIIKILKKIFEACVNILTKIVNFIRGLFTKVDKYTSKDDKDSKSENKPKHDPEFENKKKALLEYLQKEKMQFINYEDFVNLCKLITDTTLSYVTILEKVGDSLENVNKANTIFTKERSGENSSYYEVLRELDILDYTKYNLSENIIDYITIRKEKTLKLPSITYLEFIDKAFKISFTKLTQENVDELVDTFINNAKKRITEINEQSIKVATKLKNYYENEGSQKLNDWFEKFSKLNVSDNNENNLKVVQTFVNYYTGLLNVTCQGNMHLLTLINTNYSVATNETIRYLVKNFKLNNKNHITIKDMESIEKELSNIRPVTTIGEYNVYHLNDIIKISLEKIDKHQGNRLLYEFESYTKSPQAFAIKSTGHLKYFIVASDIVLKAPKDIREFILWHEYGHVKHTHMGVSFQAVVNAMQYGKTKFLQFMHNNGNRLLKQEIEADSEGVKHTSPDAAIRAMEFLKKYLPDGDSELDKRIQFFKRWKQLGHSPIKDKK